jgi:magnesium-transporting ATPase (P-type)
VWRQLAAQFTDLFAVVLLVASAITFLAYGLQQPRDVGTFRLAVAILGVVVLNASIGFAQEYSAERTAESLQAMVPHTCRVLRDGERRELPAREVVPGDVVVLDAGDAVPADCRLVEAHEVAVNNAALTGESDAVARTAEPVAPGPPLEARNCALGVCAVFFWHVHASGIPYSDFTRDNTVYREAVTMVQAGIVGSQFFNALAVRTDRQSVFRIGLLSNPWLLAAGCFGIALMATISYAPPLQAVFNTAPLGPADWAVLAAFGALLLAAEEGRKWLLRRRHTAARTARTGGTP